MFAVIALLLMLGIRLELQGTIDPYYGIVRTVEWSHNGEILAVGGNDGLWLYDENFVETAHFTDFAGPVSSISWSPDDTMLVILENRWYEEESLVTTAHIETRQILVSVSGHFTTPVVWSPDGSAIAAGDYFGVIRAWDALTGEEILSFQENVEDYAFSTNSALMLCWNASENHLIGRFFLGVYVWNLETEDVEYFARVPSVLWGSGACNPDVTVLVTTDSYRVDLTTGEYQDHWTGEYPLSSDFSVIWHPNGNHLATNSENHIVEIWDAANGELITTLEGGMIRAEVAYNEYNDSLAWSPDGSMFAEAGQDGIVRIWDAETYELIQTLDFTDASAQNED